jgi:hypothetical protein
MTTTQKPTINSTSHHRYLSDDDEHEKYAPVGIDGLLAASEKLLAVNRGLAEPDERDSLPNDRIHTVDRLMAERIKLDHGKTLRSMMGRVSRSRNLSPMGAASFDNYTTGYLVGNPLVTALEEINPMHILEQKRRITKMGPGGIGDPNAITESMQSVSADQFGFIDSIAGPECLTGDSEVETVRGWVRWDAVTSKDLFRCLVDFDYTQFLPASRIVERSYSTTLICAKTDEISMKVTPRHRVVEIAKGRRVRKNSSRDGADIFERWVMNVTPAQSAFGWSRKLPSLDLTRQFNIDPTQWYTERFIGRVYCATVPGGCLFVRGTPDSEGYWTGNSERAGIDVRLATGTRIGSDGRIYQLMRNRKTGKNQWVSPSDLVGKTLKLPD